MFWFVLLPRRSTRSSAGGSPKTCPLPWRKRSVVPGTGNVTAVRNRFLFSTNRLLSLCCAVFSRYILTVYCMLPGAWYMVTDTPAAYAGQPTVFFCGVFCLACLFCFGISMPHQVLESIFLLKEAFYQPPTPKSTTASS